ncbi:hypothetical protein V5O48_013543 [Marasmius crinis-equi]|uniref:Nephrocystin 3-like N-terminal domain-containing protein n=1 Tax=Marasmius crinis-equi TaxID=585013 RepID=A0ABR3EZX7_9AGAR
MDTLHELNRQIANVGATHDSEARYPPPRCYAETRKEVQGYFLERISRRRGGFLYWLSGYAGVGKSAIAQSISERCSKSKDLVASFFFSRNHPQRQSPSYLFLTIAHELAVSIPELREPIATVIRESNLAILTTSIESQFRELVVNPCRSLEASEGWGNRPRLIVIDGLDECEGVGMQKRVLSIISDALRDPKGLPLEFMICSRPEPSIKEFFSSTFVDLEVFSDRYTSRSFEFNPFNPRFWWYRLEDDNHASRDIHTILRDGLAKVRAEDKFAPVLFPDPWPSEHVLEILVWKSDKQFIYAKIIVKFVNDEFSNPCERLQAIVDLVPSYPGNSPFRELDGLYQHVLSVNPNQDLISQILGVMFSTCWPWVEFSLPSPKEIEYLLGLSKGQATLALRGMHAVLGVKDPDRRIIPVHKSFTDFLYDRFRAGCFYVDTAYFKPFTAVRLFWCINTHLAAYRRYVSPWNVTNTRESAIPLMSYSWYDVCNQFDKPSEELLYELRKIDFGMVCDVVMQEMLHEIRSVSSSRPRSRQDGWLHGPRKMWWIGVEAQAQGVLSWLRRLSDERLDVSDLVAHFEAAGKHFHISAPNSSTVDALLRLIGAGRHSTWALSNDLIVGSEDLLCKADCQLRVVHIEPGECRSSNSSTCALGLDPEECTPGVFCVREEHASIAMVKLSVDLIRRGCHDSDSTIVRLLIDYLRWLGPLPALLPLLQSVLPAVLTHNQEDGCLGNLLEWLKSFPEGYSSDATHLIQEVSEKASVGIRYEHDSEDESEGSWHTAYEL